MLKKYELGSEPFNLRSVDGSDLSKSAFEQVHIAGHLPRRWFANLALHLSEARISVHSGGFQSTNGYVRGTLELDLSRTEVDALQAVLDDLLHTRPAVPLMHAKSMLRHYYATSEATGVYLYVHGEKDATGLIANLLVRLEALGLYVREATLETVDGRVFDEFVLDSLSGQRPPAETLEALPALLKPFLFSA